MTVNGVRMVCSVLSERRCGADAGLEHDRHGLDAGYFRDVSRRANVELQRWKLC